MSIASQITRIQQDRNTIRTKMVELGLATNVDNLDVLAEAVDSIENKGSVSVNVKEGETYTIPKGYHSGSGTVSGIAGGGNYSLQSKAAITPTKKQQQITPDDGYYGLSDVTIGAIPDAYQDVTSVTAVAADVLTGKVIVSSTGVVTAGSMANNGAVDKTLTTADASYTVPGGYHNGEGTVKIVPEDKTVTPTKSAQDVTASAGKVLNKVSVAAIPDEYQDVTGVTAGAGDVLTGKKIVDSTGAVVDGTMTNNGSVSETLDTSEGNQSYTVPQGYHDGTGTVSIALEDKTVTPTKEAQDIVPTDGKVLSKVSVAAIPDAYQDVTSVTATADDVLAARTFVDAEGNVVDGNIPTIDIPGTTTFNILSGSPYIVQKGYHAEEVQVSPSTQIKTVIPTKNKQSIVGDVMVTPSTGANVYHGNNVNPGKRAGQYYLSEVTVEPIPDAYQDVTGVTATADKVLTGSVFVDSTGATIEGSMANNGAVTATIDGLTTLNYTVPVGYHDGTGTVSLTSDIEDALAAI